MTMRAFGAGAALYGKRSANPPDILMIVLLAEPGVAVALLLI
ncbi:hypothetical protein V3H18_09675 [Methylocystis sp. 9N]|uniref:Uncharacterized protein n=1 Tax=Methylocystis borbori TaxID=3118750 RepID=A0ABU7XHD4_9HYPH